MLQIDPKMLQMSGIVLQQPSPGTLSPDHPFLPRDKMLPIPKSLLRNPRFLLQYVLVLQQIHPVLQQRLR
jgi:hypothetical protein